MKKIKFYYEVVSLALFLIGIGFKEWINNLSVAERMFHH